MTLEAYNSMGEAQRFAVAMFTYVPYPLDQYMLDSLFGSRFRSKSVRAESVIKELMARNIIANPSANSRAKAGNAGFLAKDLTRIFDGAAASEWLPDATDLRKALDRGNVPGGASSMTLEAQAEGVRVLAGGSGAMASEQLARALVVPDGFAVARGASWHAARLLIDEPDFFIAKSTDPLVRLMRYWLNARFVLGRDVRRALLALEAAFRMGGAWDWRLVASFATHCFWVGWRKGLDAAADVSRISGSDREKEELAFILNGCKFAFDGDFANADLSFKAADRLDSDLKKYGAADVECRQVDNVAERLLAAMCAAVAKPEKIAKTRPAQVMARTWRDSGLWRGRHCPEELYADAITRISQAFTQGWKKVHMQRGELLGAAGGKQTFRPFSSLLCAWDFRMLAAGRAAMRTKTAKILPVAERAEREGYVNIAQLYLTLLSGGYDEAAAADFVKRVGALSVKFLPEIGKDDEWKAMLDAVRKAVKDAKKAESREEEEPSERVFWRVTVEKPTTKDGAFTLMEIEPVLRRRDDSDDDGGDGSPISRWDFDRKRVRMAFSDKDMIILNVLNRGGASESALESEALEKFVGLDNVLLRIVKPGQSLYFYGNNAAPPLKRVNVVAGRCEMCSSVSADGGVTLSVPKWAVEADGNVVLKPVDDGTVAVVTLSGGVRKLLAAFRDLGTDGRINIPPAAMKDAAPLIEEIAGLIPVAAPTEAEKAKLRRVAASASLAARLAFSGDVLSVRIVAKPLAAMPSLAVEPGEGQSEKVIADASGSYLLVRDLAAEGERLAGVKTALAGFETWHDGRSSWNIEDVSGALDFLVALKAIAGADKDGFAMEWMDEKKVTVASAPKSGASLGSTRAAEDWFRVDGEFTLDDGRVLSVAKMLDAAKSRVGDYVKLSEGDYVRLTKAMARQISALAAAGRRRGDGVEVPKAAIPMLDGAFGAGEDSLELPAAMAKTAEEIRSEFARRPTVPRNLAAELRPYQTDGYKWLSRLAGCGFGACLADDMGLGKTVQVIALLLARAKDGASLVVAPASVCGNWRSEILRFAPSLKPQMAYEHEDGLASFGVSDVVIASYGYLLFHEKEFADVQWNGVVLDEAQAVKNDASKRAKAVKRLQARFRVAATGTPVENRLGELWSIFDFLNPGLLGAASSFASRFTHNGMATGELKRLVKPLVLRRLKGDVLDDLPEKTESTVMVELGKAERSAYEGCRVHALQQLEADAEKDGGVPNRMSILAELTRLRRFCCHPSLVLPGEALPSAKMEALLDLLSNLHEGGHRALLFSQFTDYLAIVRRMIQAHGWAHLYLDGSTPAAERGRLVEAFQSGVGDFFVISLKAGGTGLNLTAADYVILLDPWWNPAVENQAADRVHRIGQRNPVTVYRLIAADTVEERVLELHKEKRQIAEDMLDGTGSSALSPAQLMGLFRSKGE